MKEDLVRGVLGAVTFCVYAAFLVFLVVVGGLKVALTFIEAVMFCCIFTYGVPAVWKWACARDAGAQSNP